MMIDLCSTTMFSKWTLKTFERKINHMKIKTFITEILRTIFLKKSNQNCLTSVKMTLKQMISSEFHHFFLMIG